MSYGWVCRKCVFKDRMCNGMIDEDGQCDMIVTKAERRRRIARVIKSVVETILYIAAFAAVCAAVTSYAKACHAKHCTGSGKCGWAWCANYNGSDALHDFNF